MQLQMGLTFTLHMVDIHTTQIALEVIMRKTGLQQEATQFKSKQKVMIYNFRETVSEFEEFTHCHNIKASKVKEMYLYVRDFERQCIIPRG